VTVIEWGERIAPVLPDDRLTVELRYPDLDSDGDGTGDGTGDGAGGGADDERQLRLGLGGPSWRRRADAVIDALGAGMVPC
jgi:hypothetical protein